MMQRQAIDRAATKQVISKKIRSSPKLRRIFRPKSEIQTVLSPESRQLLHNFLTKSLRGAVFMFGAKIGLKSTKNVPFCILFRPMEEARAPPPPPPAGYATGIGMAYRVRSV